MLQNRGRGPRVLREDALCELEGQLRKVEVGVIHQNTRLRQERFANVVVELSTRRGDERFERHERLLL